MSERGPTLLHALRETFATFQRGRGVLLRCYSASTPQALFNYASPPGSSGVVTLPVFIQPPPTAHTIDTGRSNPP